MPGGDPSDPSNPSDPFSGNLTDPTDHGGDIGRRGFRQHAGDGTRSTSGAAAPKTTHAIPPTDAKPHPPNSVTPSTHQSPPKSTTTLTTPEPLPCGPWSTPPLRCAAGAGHPKNHFISVHQWFKFSPLQRQLLTKCLSVNSDCLPPRDKRACELK